MKLPLLVLLATLVSLAPTKLIADERPAVEAPLASLELTAGTSLVFAEPAAAREVLLADDDYSRRLSRFDLQARLQTDRAVTKDDWKKLVTEQVVDWTPVEREKISKVVESLRPKLAPYRLRLPKEVLLIRTTGKEEGEAAYTRGNSIILPSKVLRYPSPQFDALILHELFHVLSRHDAATRHALYKIVGFTVRDEIEIPASLEERRITNPDAPRLDSFIELKNDEQQVTAVPIIYATPKDYDAKIGGTFFRYVTFKLLVVDKVDGKWQPRLRGDQPVVLDPAKVTSFHDQIGKNTNYIIHPDEILADNFVHLIQRIPNLATPRIVEQMADVLKP
ncbi:hypothetical protein ETAA8_69810 [Anatilimnocola aggregata]|uniref:DUF4157 domain-containing protein n=1 Tax=Anatilimnocola aggregata TaxID=2528021 RepID=A0A517YNM8_9BACT|nr:hypothetical protein [Anatilimnocola aggregata]QDU31821.1 hypothetical protein ETAA8_69810 [Anatilimnocola aggregata]